MACEMGATAPDDAGKTVSYRSGVSEVEGKDPKDQARQRVYEKGA